MGVGERRETDQAICITSHVDSGPDLESEVFVEGKVKYHQINQQCGPFLPVTVTWCFRQSSTREHRCSQ